MPHVSHTGGPQGGVDLGDETYSDAAQDEHGWWYASHFQGRHRTTVGPFLDRDEALAALRIVGDEPTPQIVGRRLEGPAIAPRLVDDRIATRSSFISLLWQEIPRALTDLDDGRIPLSHLYEAAIASGIALMGRFLMVKDGADAMTLDTAHRLAVGVLWGAAAALKPYQVHQLGSGMLPEADTAKTWGDTDYSISRAVQRLLSGRPAEGSDAEMLDSIVPRLINTTFQGRLASWEAHPWGSPWAGHEEVLAEAHGVTEVGLSRGGCYGPCPVYTVTFRRSSPATYLGSMYVERMGQYESELDTTAFDDIARALIYLGLASLKPRYAIEATDHATTTAWLIREGEVTSVSDYGGAGPAELHLAFELLDGVVDGLVWRPVARESGAPAMGGRPPTS